MSDLVRVESPSYALSNHKTAFLLEYVRDFNVSRAAEACGISRAAASNWMKEPSFRDALDKELLSRKQTDTAEQLMVLQILGQIARASFANYQQVMETGDCSQIAPEYAAAIKTLTTESFTRNGETAVRTKLELHDKIRAAELIGKYHGMFADKQPGGVNAGAVQVNFNIDWE